MLDEHGYKYFRTKSKPDNNEMDGIGGISPYHQLQEWKSIYGKLYNFSVISCEQPGNDNPYNSDNAYIFLAYALKPTVKPIDKEIWWYRQHYYNGNCAVAHYEIYKKLPGLVKKSMTE